MLIPSKCAICGSPTDASELYPANFKLEAFNLDVFSARRQPDRIHYRLVRCNVCGLVRSDPVAATPLLAELYAKSRFNYASEVPHLRRTYGRYLSKLEGYGVRKGKLLEIGAGNGFLLEEALSQGYREVRGVEPSQDAIAQAPTYLQTQFICDMMRPGLFELESIDVICLMQLLDHIPNPRELLAECHRLCKPGGFLLLLHHNVEAFSARFLGAKSPIVDIEHTYLYSPATLSRILILSGFEVLRVATAWNTYSMQYLCRLWPLRESLKRFVVRLMEQTGLARFPWRVPLGNLWAVAHKPSL